MSEKRFFKAYFTKQIIDKVTDKCYPIRDGESIDELVDLLNEQQELIEELHSSDHMGWGRAEKFEKELKQKKIYIKRLEYKVQKFKEMNSEQQATIQSLQTELELISGEKLFSRRELERKVKEQQDTIEHLKKRLYDFEKRKIIEESEIDEDVIPKVKVLRTELFGEKYE